MRSAASLSSARALLSSSAASLSSGANSDARRHQPSASPASSIALPDEEYSASKAASSASVSFSELRS